MQCKSINTELTSFLNFLFNSDSCFIFSAVSAVEATNMFQVILLYLIIVSNLVSLTVSKGSTTHLREIVIGKCWDYQRLKSHEVTKNCSKIWGIFSKAFAYKDPCSVSFADYKTYFDEVGMDIVKPNKVIWIFSNYAHIIYKLVFVLYLSAELCNFNLTAAREPRLRYNYGIQESFWFDLNTINVKVTGALWALSHFELITSLYMHVLRKFTHTGPRDAVERLTRFK